MTSDIKYSLVSLVNTELQIIQSVCGQDTCCRHPNSIMIASGLSGQSSEGAKCGLLCHPSF